LTGRDDNELFIVASNGLSEHPLTDNDVDDQCPSWSRVSRRIVFEREGSLATIRPDGSGFRIIAAATSSVRYFAPIWAPNSNWLVATRYSSARPNGDLIVMRADGTNKDRVTTTSFGPRQYAWAPNGKKIAFVPDRSRDGPYSIWVTTRRGRHSHIVDRDTGTFAPPTPSWSRNSERLVYTQESPGGDTGPHFDLWTVRGDGTGRHAVTMTRHREERVATWYGPPGPCP
jgi:Tol biopolymer transport system component